MKEFTKLYLSLEEANSEEGKIEGIKSYFSKISDTDKLCAIALLAGKQTSRIVATKVLKEIALDYTGIKSWLYEESYSFVGNHIETVSLILPSPTVEDTKSLSEWVDVMDSLKRKSKELKSALIKNAWDSLVHEERFLFNKLICGNFKSNLLPQVLSKALAGLTSISKYAIANRLSSDWSIQTTDYNMLIVAERAEDVLCVPYPFLFPEKLMEEPKTLGMVEEWQAEPLWDGFRIQLINRAGKIFIWSANEDLVTSQFPELELLRTIDQDDFVLDGMIVPFKEGLHRPFHHLTRRNTKKKVSAKQLIEDPVILICHDILELEGKDIRRQRLAKRKELLRKLITELNAKNSNLPLVLSETLSFQNWSQAEEIHLENRKVGIKGLILKKLNADYEEGNFSKVWVKWKPKPLEIKAILIYALGSSSSRSTNFIEYTFGVWRGDSLISITKAYEGLQIEEHQEIRAYILANTIEKHGPVRVIKPVLVFTLSFQDVEVSTRHKSGLKLKKAQIVSWNKSMKPEDCGTLKELKQRLN